jgi:prevent-host-death family protein
MREVALADAKNRLSALIQEVEETGAEIVITRHGKPAVKLSPVQKAQTPEERVALVRQLLANAEAMAAKNPEAAKPIPWETVKRWMRDEEDDD